MNNADLSALAPTSDIVETFHGVAVPDPYRPLEDLDAPATKTWIDAQNTHLQAFLAPQADEIARLTQFMNDQVDYPREGLPGHHGKYWTRSYNPGLAPQPVTQIADAPTGPWRTLLDPLEIDSSGNTSVNGIFMTEDGALTAYTLSVGGGDETTLYVMDTATSEKLPDQIDDCRFTSVIWDADNGGFHYTYPASATETRTVLKYHKLGTPVASDTLIYSDPHPESFVGYSRSRRSGLETIEIQEGTDDRTRAQIRLPGESAWRPLIQTPERISLIDLIDGKIYAISKADTPRGALVAIDPLSPQNRAILVAEQPDAVLESAMRRCGKLFLFYTVDTADKVVICDMDGTATGQMDLPPRSVLGMAADNLDDTGCYVSIGSDLTPGNQYYYDYRHNTLELFARSKAPDTLEDCILERVHATSKDGTKIPMTIIRHPSTRLDGTAAVKLYGYGGFNVALTPGFKAIGVLSWIRAGGIYAEANLRGGGEFGAAWYDGGRKLKKQNVFDDFIACGEYLVTNNYTSPKRLTTSGGSNGGLLTLAVMLQRPDLFGAVISDVPVTDMLRFDLHTYGAAWKSDYGDPKVDKADFDVSMSYSPVHAVKAGQLYPPHLVLTGDHDTRVMPLHAYKFVATMQKLAAPATKSFLHVAFDAGHGGGKSLQKTIEEAAIKMAFCAAAIGPLDQNRLDGSKPRRGGPVMGGIAAGVVRL